MKKVFLLLLVSMFFFGRPGHASPPVSVMIDGQIAPLSQTPIINHGRVLVPLRGVFQQLGATVNYDPVTHNINAIRSGADITLGLGSRIAAVNGTAETLDTAPLNMNGAVYVPLRFVSESLGALVSWLPNTRTVDIVSRTGGIFTTSPSNLPPVPGMSPSISGLSISPKSARAGENVTVTMTGTPGGNGTITLSDGEKIALTETSPGTYTGTFAVPAGLAGNAVDMTSRLTLPNGQMQTLTTRNALSVASAHHMTTLPGGMLPFEVIEPNPAAIVSEPFIVRGVTQPHALVRLRIVANNKEVYNTQTFADGAGNFHFDGVNTGGVGSGAVLNVEMHAENTLGQTSDVFRMQIQKQ